MRPLVRGDEVTTGGDWGSPSLDPSAVANPTSPSAAAATRATQVANEAQRVALAAAQLAPPPFGAPFVDAGGFVSTSWVPWLTRLHQRTGGVSVTSATDMDVLTEFDDLPEPPRLVEDPLAWMTSLSPEAQIALLAQQVDALTGLVLGSPERGWNRQAGLTADVGAAPAGGTGAAAGAWDTAAHRDAAIATLNNLRTRLGEVETVLKAVRIL